MNIKTSFTLRFRTSIAGHPFQSEIECDDLSDVTEVCRQMSTSSASPDLVAALMYFDILSVNGGTPDDLSEKIIIDLCTSLKVGAERFMNATMGSYDQLTNSVTPVDLGMVLPDGTLRIVWDEDEALLSFDETLRVLDNALWLLLRLQKLPKFNMSDDDYDNDVSPDVIEGRRTDVLFEAGLWADSSGQFEEENKDVRVVLEKHSL